MSKIKSIKLLLLFDKNTSRKRLLPHISANAPETDRKDLLSELEVMKTLEPHPHVIKLLGCVTESGKLGYK